MSTTELYEQIHDLQRHLTAANLEVAALRATVAKLTEELREIGGILGIEDETDKSDPEQVIGQAVVVQCIRRGLVKQRDQLRVQLAERDGQIAALRKADETGCDCGEPGLPDVPGHLAQCARWRLPSQDPAVQFLGAAVLALRETLIAIRFEANESGHCAGCGSDGFYDASGQCPDECAVQAVLENTAQAAAAHDERVRAEET